MHSKHASRKVYSQGDLYAKVAAMMQIGSRHLKTRLYNTILARSGSRGIFTRKFPSDVIFSFVSNAPISYNTDNKYLMHKNITPMDLYYTYEFLWP